MPGTVAILLISSITVLHLRDPGDRFKGIHESYAFVADKNLPVYVDSRSVYTMEYAADFRPTANLIEYPESLTNVDDAYVIINTDVIRNVKEANPWMEFPAEIENPKSTWELVKEFEAKEGIVQIYYAPKLS